MASYEEDLRHEPVLLQEVMEALGVRPGGVYLDGTLGAGGHARAVLSRFSDTRVIGIDRDPAVLEVARRELAPFKGRVRFFHSNYDRLGEVVEEAGWGHVDGLLLDLGVSSLQLDSPNRGFSFASDGPLDMRMDPGGMVTAAQIVNSADTRELAGILARFGEEKLAGRIAAAIVRERAVAPVNTTGRLAAIVAAVPGMGRVRNIHPATRTFQALRIAVNEELTALEGALAAGVLVLKDGGRFAVISFHSLEDRIVKRAFRSMASDCRCPAGAPICTCDEVSLGHVVTRKPVRPGSAETETNPRSRSARLRVFERSVEP